jgi:hypothetical protein
MVEELIDELIAARDALAPTIRGLEDLQHVSLSAQSLAAVTETLADHVRRRDLLQAAIDALIRLDADGYPELPKTAVMEGVYQELQVQLDDIEAAIAEFEQEPTATTINVVLGQPANKPIT